MRRAIAGGARGWAQGISGRGRERRGRRGRLARRSGGRAIERAPAIESTPGMESAPGMKSARDKCECGGEKLRKQGKGSRLAWQRGRSRQARLPGRSRPARQGGTSACLCRLLTHECAAGGGASERAQGWRRGDVARGWALDQVLRKTSAAPPTCASMTPTRSRRTRSMSSPSSVRPCPACPRGFGRMWCGVQVLPETASM
jgi:hypothetical protein